VLCQQLRNEALPLADPFQLDGNRVDRLLELPLSLISNGGLTARCKLPSSHQALRTNAKQDCEQRVDGGVRRFSRSRGKPHGDDVAK
jgi:hypothetical protein